MVAVTPTDIPGLLVINLDVRGDNRGWFKENWQRAKMVELGLPDFGPVQNNMSFNTRAGATRGIHAEPWDKLVSLAKGRIFGAWVDLRPGDHFGRSFTIEMGPETAVYVPRGVGNAFQTLEDETAYSYLVNDHWSLAAKDSYTFLNLADETVAIDWPIPLAQAELSAADEAHPRLAEVTPMAPRPTLIIGANGQLGRALSAALPDAVAVGRERTRPGRPAIAGRLRLLPVRGDHQRRRPHQGRRGRDRRRAGADAWAVNATGVAALVAAAREHRSTLVHISTDYVFDGTAEVHTRGRAVLPAGRVRPEQGRRRRRGGHPAARTTSCGPAG